MRKNTDALKEIHAEALELLERVNSAEDIDAATLESINIKLKGAIKDLNEIMLTRITNDVA
ncbi:MAG: hypothetical protein GX459_12815 [Bacteroidales bacterium]|nr:hypothetical protein [Bacteroidales bacterium]